MAQHHFWQSTLLYIYRPNLINRRYIGAQLINCWRSCCDSKVPELRSILDSISHNDSSIDYLKSTLHLTETESTKIEVNDLCNSSKNQSTIIIVRKLFLKKSMKKLQNDQLNLDSSIPIVDAEYDIVILIPVDNKFAIIPIDLNENLISGNFTIRRTNNSTAFMLSLSTTSLNTLTVNYLFDFEPNYWTENVLKIKLEKWIRNSLESPDQSDNTFQGSIKQISVESYCANYNLLKAKHSLSLLDIWSKVEKTDPIKFIFEDIAIAAYLITLWQEEEIKLELDRRQTFLDVGCGNGLLVYILSREGYTGYGVDIRKRNIWSHYGDDVNLIEMQIDVFDEQSFAKLPKCCWMIGNHSDELTPWLVYMASVTSPYTRAFILPCCCFDFDGFKFQRTIEPNKSQYQCYIDYLEQLSKDFGFKCLRDKLRIPSTKRICLILNGRDNIDDNSGDDIEPQTAEIRWNEKRRKIVQERLQIRSTLRLREKEEIVRNCTQMDQQIKDRIIGKMAEAIFLKQQGLEFKEAIELLDDQSRTEMKNQCGGLQTFVRNHRHIFTIADCRIQFASMEQLRVKVPGRTKTKECWFLHNHPEGCPLDQSECAYKHTLEE